MWSPFLPSFYILSSLYNPSQWRATYFRVLHSMIDQRKDAELMTVMGEGSGGRACAGGQAGGLEKWPSGQSVCSVSVRT